MPAEDSRDGTDVMSLAIVIATAAVMRRLVDEAAVVFAKVSRGRSG